jgi:hypothetical protein
MTSSLAAQEELLRHGSVELVHVRNEEGGAFVGVTDARPVPDMEAVEVPELCHSS